MVSTDENYLIDSKTPFDQGALPGTWYGPILSELQLGIYFL